MENYISINGKKIKLSDETVKEFKKQLGEKTPQLPKSWEELGRINGSYVNGYGEFVGYSTDYPCEECNKSIWPSEELAKAAVAMSQLAQLRDRYNDGWKPDWETLEEEKYAIQFSKQKLTPACRYVIKCFLVFKTKELRDAFLENFRDLIETAKPLL